MSLSRKILLPALLVALFLLSGLSAIAALNLNAGVQAQERETLQSAAAIFTETLTAQQELTAALALQTAANPQIQQAFAQGNRQALIELALPAYRQLDQSSDITLYQFNTPPATAFLRLHQLDQFGDDLSAFSPTVMLADAEKRLASGLEIGPRGLGMHSAAPISYEGLHIGTVELGVHLDARLLTDLKTRYNVDWQILLSKSMAEAAAYAGPPGQVQGPIPELWIQATTLERPVFAPAGIYRRVLAGQTGLARVQGNGLNYTASSLPLRDSTGKVIGVVEILSDRTQLIQNLTTRLIASLLIVVLGVILGGGALSLILNRALRPIASLTEAAAEVSQGNLNRTVPVESADEVGLLAQTFNSMTAQLRGLVFNLEQRVQERTRALERRRLQLQAAAQVARDASAMGNPETLMQQMVDLIADRFGFYYAAIFLIEPGGQFAELKAGTGEAGRQMIARGHKLHIGQVGIVGYVTSTGEPRVSLDVGGDSVHYRNPLLPDTQSEMALPLKVGVRVIGALDVQSREKNAFSQEDVQTLQLMADQLAFVIENARLFSENQAALEASRRAYSELGRRAWLDLLRIRSIGYRADHLGVNPLPSQNGGLHPAAASPQVIDLPIVVRDQVIGVVQAHKPESRGGWSPTEQALMKTLISQLGEALDSARLYNDMQRRAAREKLTSDIATRIRQTLDVETVLRSAADEIYHSLALEEVTVALVEEDQAPIAASQPGAPDAAQAIG